MVKSHIPYKSVAVAILLSIMLGPIGLLYASFWGGFAMIILALIIIPSQLMYPIVLLWVLCCIWSVGAVESYNRHLLNEYYQK